MIRAMVFRPVDLLCALAMSLVGIACGETPARPPASIATPAVVERQSVPEVRAAAPQWQGGAVATTSTRHDLSSDEVLGGHTLERHVGRTDEQLRERLRREPNISAASTYTDRDTAEQVIGRAFEESAAMVDRWASRTGRRPNLLLDRTEPRAIGRSLRRSAHTASDCDHALVVVRWDERRSRSYVLTSYPECRP